MADAPLHRWIERSLSYEGYLDDWHAKLDAPLKGLDKTSRRYLFYARYNWARSEQVHAHYEVSENLRQALAALRSPQQWLVLTEDWCVDSAYSLPIIASAAAESSHVDLHILPRDNNQDVMDCYLTNGARSIPKLIAFGPDGEERFVWGPRPAAAQALRQELVDADVPGAEISARLLGWYEAGGWADVDGELEARLSGIRKGSAAE